MNIFYKLLRNIYHKYFKPDSLPVQQPGLISSLKQSGLVVGKDFKIHEQVIIDSGFLWLITIGDNVTLAPRVQILAHDGSTKKFLGYTKIGKVNIGNRVFIGASTIVLPGVQIGNDVAIGAGSLVAYDIPDNSIAAGNPAKVLCSLDDFRLRKKAEMANYPCFGEEYLKGSCSDELKKEMIEKMESRFGYIR